MRYDKKEWENRLDRLDKRIKRNRKSKLRILLEELFGLFVFGIGLVVCCLIM